MTLNDLKHSKRLCNILTNDWKYVVRGATLGSCQLGWHKWLQYGSSQIADSTQIIDTQLVGLRGSAVERQSLASVLSPSCTRPVADGWPLMWVAVHYKSNNQINSAVHPLGVDKWVVAAIRCRTPHLVEAPSGERLRGKGWHGVLCRLKAVWSMPARFKAFVYHARRYTSTLLFTFFN